MAGGVVVLAGFAVGVDCKNGMGAGASGSGLAIWMTVAGMTVAG